MLRTQAKNIVQKMIMEARADIELDEEGFKKEVADIAEGYRRNEKEMKARIEYENNLDADGPIWK